MAPRRTRQGCGAGASRCWTGGKTCWAEFTLRLCLPRTDADNAARLLDLQTWAAAESAAGRGPVLGNAGREVLRAEQGRMERADAGGTAIYTVRLQAEYTQVYTEETT